MNWQDYKGRFEFDGSWRDIYVLGTDAGDWQRLVDFFRSGSYKWSYKIDRQDVELPLRAAEILEAADEHKRLLWVDVAGVMLCCHFWEQEQIELDLDPREVRGEFEAEQVFDLTRQIGQMLSKEVILTHENAPDEVIFKFDPATGQLHYDQSAPGPWVR